jgi:hypothetical protein
MSLLRGLLYYRRMEQALMTALVFFESLLRIQRGVEQSVEGLLTDRPRNFLQDSPALIWFSNSVVGVDAEPLLQQQAFIQQQRRVGVSASASCSQCVRAVGSRRSSSN